MEKIHHMIRAFKLYGAGVQKHRQITDEELHKIREKVALKMAKKLNLKVST